MGRKTIADTAAAARCREQMRTSWIMKGIQRSPEGGGYVLAFDTPQGPKRLHAKVAVCTAPAHRLSGVEGLRVRTMVGRALAER